MVGWLVLLFSRRTPPSPPGPPGGVFRRRLTTFRRKIAREPKTWPRVVSRELTTLARVWRFTTVPTIPTEGSALTAAVSDDRDYGFDFQYSPELKAANARLESCSVSGGTGLTIGIPQVITEFFDDIPTGKGVSVRISGGVAGTTYNLACIGTLPNGRKITIPGRLLKVADFGT